ncbi:MAG: hypothetical protein FDZ70_10430 [Actinobacteria bacterium]|nr:MAG: hypothetical protein FDZ70_10430 [Actinomycetota bacterium]
MGGFTAVPDSYYAWLGVGLSVLAGGCLYAAITVSSWTRKVRLSPWGSQSRSIWSTSARAASGMTAGLVSLSAIEIAYDPGSLFIFAVIDALGLLLFFVIQVAVLTLTLRGVRRRAEQPPPAEQAFPAGGAPQ